MIFDQEADRYDAWFDTPAGRTILDAELDALRPLLAGLPEPKLEVGVGTGRVAAALGVSHGLDPAFGPLQHAARRCRFVVQGVGEALPFRDGSFGVVLLMVTLCFVANPSTVLREARRVLQPGGGLLLGLLPAEGAWGRRYRELGEQGHAYYRHARFFGRAELAAMLAAAGLEPVRARSTLWQPPNGEPRPETACDGDDPSAGFLALLARPV